MVPLNLYKDDTRPFLRSPPDLSNSASTVAQGSVHHGYGAWHVSQLSGVGVSFVSVGNVGKIGYKVRRFDLNVSGDVTNASIFLIALIEIAGLWFPVVRGIPFVEGWRRGSKRLYSSHADQRCP